MFIAALVVLFILKLRFPRGQSIANILTRRYGRPTLRLFRQFEKSTQKLEKLKCDRKFLIICKSHEVLPKFLHFKLYRKNLQNSKLYKSWQFKLLNLEIVTKNKQINKSQKLLNEIKAKLQESVSNLDFTCLNNFAENSTKKVINRIDVIHRKKLENLGISSQMYPLDPNVVIFNFSNKILSDKERNLLTLGLNFKLPIYRLNFFDYFLSFENLYNYLSKFDIFNPHDTPNILKNTLHNIAHKYFYKFKPNKVFCPFFSKHEINILRNLAKDRSITICRPDKGTGIVILNKSDYEDKMLTILNDHSKFKQMHNINPLQQTLRCEDKINRFLRQLKNSKTITPTTYTTLSTSGSTPGVIYGLPKTHKPNHPLRPILSACNTPNYNIAKYLVKLLTPLTTNQYTLRNSYDFVHTITNIPSNNKTMHSFDIESLFTNIPLNETIDICLDTVFSNTNTFHNFTRKQFKTLLDLATKETYFIFKDNLFQQIDGVAMGSPLGPTLANIFMCHHERKWLNQCPATIKPLIYQRYIDDTFLLFNDSQNPKQFLDYLNVQHNNINFTSESENNNSISFLDINITKNPNNFETSVFRKNTFTGLGTNFLSHTPFEFKISCIKTLIYRAYHISSTYINFNKEITFLRNFFFINKFPINLFNLHLKKFLNNIYNPISQPIINVPKHKIYCKIPYCGYLTNKIKIDLTNFICKHFPQLNVRLISVNKKSIGSFFKHKHRLPDYLCSSIIYSFSSLDSDEVQYIGSTIRQLQCRIDEHKGISVRTKMPITKPLFSAIRDHCHNKNITISDKQFKIINHSFNPTDIRTLESLHITKQKPPLNTGIPVELNIL